MVECTTRYEPRRPEATTLYRVFQEHLETFLARVEEDGRSLPAFVVRELRQFLECGILAHGFARVRCANCREDLLVPFSCKRRGFCPSCCGRRMSATAAHLVDHVIPSVPVRHFVFTLPVPVRYLFVYRPDLADRCLARYLATIFRWTAERAGATVDPSSGCGSVTFIQRFSGSLGLFLHWHSLVLSGSYEPDHDGRLRFLPLPDPSVQEVRDLEARLAKEILATLEDHGVFEQGDFALSPEELQPTSGLEACQGASILNRVAFGHRTGRPIRREGRDPLARYLESRHEEPEAGRSDGFSLFVGQAIPSDRRDLLEKLARYVSRPPVTDERLSFTDEGRVRLELKRPAHDGATALVFDGPELIERLASLIPPPRRNLLRYHGILAPNAAWRSSVVPLPGSGSTSTRTHDELTSPTEFDPVLLPPRNIGPAPRTPNADSARPPRWIRWADLLRRVFRIEVLRCPKCSGPREIIAFIFEGNSIARILEHLGLPTSPPAVQPARPERQARLEFGE